MRYKLFKTNQFKRSYKKLKIKDDDEVRFIDISYHLLNAMPLDENYKDHQLQGSLREFRECHIKPDLLLIYKIENETLYLVNIGTHSDLFG